MKRSLVVDANVLISDVLRFTRTGVPTALSQLIRVNGTLADVYVPPSVIDDVNDHLGEVAARKMDADSANAVFHKHYSPFLFIETSASSGTAIERDLASRDSDDVPLLRLALSLDAVLLSKDRDLLDSGAAVSEWLDVVFAITTVGSIEGGLEVLMNLLLALPAPVQLALAAATVLLGLSRGHRSSRFRAGASAVAQEVLSQYRHSANIARTSRIGSRIPASRTGPMLG